MGANNSTNLVGGKDRRGGLRPRGSPVCWENKRIRCRNVVVSPCPRGDKARALRIPPSRVRIGCGRSPRGIRASSFSTRGWTAPRPESAWDGFLRVAVPQTPRGGSQEMRQGLPRRGDSSPPFLQGFTCRVLGGHPISPSLRPVEITWCQSAKTSAG